METPKALPDKMQMIDGNGVFFSSKTEKFLEELKKSSSTSSHYTVISIIGRQSGGKSYLLNSLFGTEFNVLDASKGWNQTTKGIWIAKCITPRIIIMDIEGYEGKEREEDTLFERQSALFSLTVSDVLLLNMKFYEVGLVESPLLKLIFQERVNIDPNMEFSSKTTLIICVRDYEYETPLEWTKGTLEKRINELWDKVHPATTNRKMSDYIQVIVKDFPHKKEQKEFDGKSKHLAEFLWQFCTNGSQQHKHYASTFAHGSQKIWDLIREYKRISSAYYKLAMSTHVCEESKKEILGSFAEMKEYKSLMSDESMPVKEFNKKLQIFLTIITTRYEAATTAIKGDIREQVKENLVKETIKIFQPTFEEKIDSLCAYTLSKAKSEIRDELKKISVLDASTVTGAIRPYMEIFNENSRPDVQHHFKDIHGKKQRFVADELIKIAEEEAENIEILRILGTTVKVATKMTIGTAWGFCTFDPSLFVSGAVTSTSDIYKAVKRSRNKNERRIHVKDIIDES